MSLIDVEKVEKYYGENHILKGVDFSINAGQVKAIMGPSGSGKSTLMNLLGCLDTPSDGSYELNGKDVARMSDNELADIRNREIGFVFQSFNLLARADALHNVELPLIYAGSPPKERRERARQTLVNVGLGERMHHRPNELSGGQRQRIGIARALYNNPDVLVLDEATSSLDTETEHGVMQAVQALQGDKTVIIVAHRLSTVEYCDRLYRLENAQIVDEGTFSEVTSRTKDLPRDADQK